MIRIVNNPIKIVFENNSDISFNEEKRLPSEIEKYNYFISLLWELKYNKDFPINTNKYRTIKGQYKKKREYALNFLKKYPLYYDRYLKYCNTENHYITSTFTKSFNVASLIDQWVGFIQLK